VTGARRLLRRYFVINGFDGALTMLGLTIGFRMQGNVPVDVAIPACLGAAIALGMSGLTSAYISEVAEQRREQRELEAAMVDQLGQSVYGQAARVLPFVVAITNGLAPLLLALLVVVPLWLARAGVELPMSPYDAAASVAFAAIFLLGVFLGRVGAQFWLWTGIRAVLVALLTVAIIVAVGV